VGTLQKKLLKPPLDFSTPALPLFFVQESEVSLSCYSNWAMKMTPHILTNLVFEALGSFYKVKILWTK